MPLKNYVLYPRCTQLSSDVTLVCILFNTSPNSYCSQYHALWPTCLKGDFSLLLLLLTQIYSVKTFCKAGKAFFHICFPLWWGNTSLPYLKSTFKALKLFCTLFGINQRTSILYRNNGLPCFVWCNIWRELGKLTPPEKWLWILSNQGSKKDSIVLGNIMPSQIISANVKATQERKNTFAFTILCLHEHLSIISYWEE